MRFLHRAETLKLRRTWEYWNVIKTFRICQTQNNIDSRMHFSAFLCDGLEFLNSLPNKYILSQVCHYLDYKDLWFDDKHLMKFESIYWCHSEQDNGHFICVMFPVFCWYWVTQTWQFGFLCLLMISSHRSSSRKFIWTNIELRVENLTRNCQVQVPIPRPIRPQILTKFENPPKKLFFGLGMTLSHMG